MKERRQNEGNVQRRSDQHSRQNNNSRQGQNRRHDNNKNSDISEVKFKSSNMNYIFNVEYFDYTNDQQVREANRQICMYEYPVIEMFEELKNEKEYESFALYTTYPGLLMGSGNLHDISCKGAYKLGFSFDYVNGLPYLPGASLKGMLRSVFPGQHKEDKEEYSDYLIGLMDEIGIDHIQLEDLEKLEEEIFDFQDIFLGAYPDPEQKDSRKYLASEYITPHKPLKNPNPISFLKVKPGIRFCFYFLIKDGKILSAQEKISLFKKLIVEFGVGAKTNVGFGKFVESKPKETIKPDKYEDTSSGRFNRPNGQYNG